jgi:hypothetical protein
VKAEAEHRVDDHDPPLSTALSGRCAYMNDLDAACAHLVVRLLGQIADAGAPCISTTVTFAPSAAESSRADHKAVAAVVALAAQDHRALASRTSICSDHCCRRRGARRSPSASPSKRRIPPRIRLQPADLRRCQYPHIPAHPCP